MHVAVLDDYQGRAHEFADWDSLGAAVHFFTDPIPATSCRAPSPASTRWS